MLQGFLGKNYVVLHAIQNCCKHMSFLLIFFVVFVVNESIAKKMLLDHFFIAQTHDFFFCNLFTICC
jgi:hypothetical protein